MTKFLGCLAILGCANVWAAESIPQPCKQLMLNELNYHFLRPTNKTDAYLQPSPENQIFYKNGSNSMKLEADGKGWIINQVESGRGIKIKMNGKCEVEKILVPSGKKENTIDPSMCEAVNKLDKNYFEKQDRLNVLTDSTRETLSSIQDKKVDIETANSGGPARPAAQVVNDLKGDLKELHSDLLKLKGDTKTVNGDLKKISNERDEKLAPFYDGYANFPQFDIHNTKPDAAIEPYVLKLPNGKWVDTKRRINHMHLCQTLPFAGGIKDKDSQPTAPKGLSAPVK